MQFIHPSKSPYGKMSTFAFFLCLVYHYSITNKEKPMHFQKVLHVFQSMVESLEKEMALQTELISQLEEQNATLHEYCMFLKKELEELKQQPEKQNTGPAGKTGKRKR